MNSVTENTKNPLTEGNSAVSAENGSSVPVIEAKSIRKYFEVPGGVLHAVDGVSFKIAPGTTLGIVGESGCGKSTLGRVICHLEESTAGKLYHNGKDVTNLNHAETRGYRESVQIIFQDPYSSLNPRLTVEQTIREPIKNSKKRMPPAELRQKVKDLMELTGIEERLQMSYPHELDGGRRQRVGIARALANNPGFIVCDEPVSSLDVSVQAQIINLLMDIQEQTGLSLMFITHDLYVVRHIATNIGVMYLGQMVEMASAKELFETQLHPYTKALLSAVPSVDILNPSKRIVLKGELTSPINPKPGCRFAARCPHAEGKCSEPQKLAELSPGHFAACCRAKELG